MNETEKTTETVTPSATVDDSVHPDPAIRLPRLLWGLAHNAGKRSPIRAPRWAHVKHATGFGSTASRAVCIDGGVDPDEYVGGRPEHDCSLDCEEHSVIELALAECAPTEDQRDAYMEKHPSELPGLVRAAVNLAASRLALIESHQRVLKDTTNTLAEKFDCELAQPIPMILWCPMCHRRHVDEGEYATKPHKTHACQHCGFQWAQSVRPTVGVGYLPGCRNQ